MKRILYYFFCIFVTYGISVCVADNISKSRDIAYNEMVTNFVKMHYPIAEESQQELVIHNILGVDYIKDEILPCLSEISEYTNEIDPAKNIAMLSSMKSECVLAMDTLNDRLYIAVAEVQTGVKIRENTYDEKLNARNEGLKILSKNNAGLPLARSCAEKLYFDIRQVSVYAMYKAKGAENIKFPLDENKIPCGAALIGEKDGSVIVNFPKNCVVTNKLFDNAPFDVSIYHIIKWIQEISKEDGTFTCEGYKCIWRMNKKTFENLSP